MFLPSSQASTALVSDTKGYPNGSYNGNSASSGKLNSPAKMNGSLGVPYANGLANNNNKTCLTFSDHSRSSRGGGGHLPNQYIHLNGKTNSAQSPKSFTNGHINGYEKDYVNGLHEHSRFGEEKVSKNTPHLKSFGNGIINGLTKPNHSGSMNLEVESRNNKNVTFKFDGSLLKNEKRNGINVTMNGKHEVDQLKSQMNGKTDCGVKANNGEVADEISTEL